jgi:hypothetical protein
VRPLKYFQQTHEVPYREDMRFHEKTDVTERANPWIQWMRSQLLAQRREANSMASIELTTPIKVTFLLSLPIAVSAGLPTNRSES